MAAESPAGPEPRMSMRVEWVAAMVKSGVLLMGGMRR
jgi:hypothetical protein